ncbi:MULTISPECIES: substrate-binding domain-containing protein [unclassified Amycolatopsis]|uniref:LacI family DNA-binding transcriptional regulator n=1 Tax=unclassified Amycolatopsis TaxID=2618356 RepID=UPI002874B51F|nr:MULTISPECIES: substrate-binding domain-containing protein [unclassified Amycolatopsis]MDS0134054.1 substrate-binding domain-containing protein [Amycolatopsis sp. 505]MDS0144930.1 substrate-binding domain-containing protein [Amycolatopsis sp. CM201R]
MTALSPDLRLWDPPVTYRIGVAMGVHAHPNSGELLRAIRAAAAQAGCDVVLADTEDTVGEEAAVVRALRADLVDGVLLVPSAGDEAVVNGLVRMGVPTVLVDRVAARNDVDQVGTENVHAMASLVRHLTDRRHRKIGLISGDEGLEVSRERIRGYRLGLEQAGLRFNRELVESGFSNAGGATRATAKLLDGWPSPTALVVADESMLVGVQYEAHRRGIRIGSELAVVGYGDMDWARRVSPAVTTLVQPIADVGRRAVQLLMSRMADPDRPQESVWLTPKFLHGASCGC